MRDITPSVPLSGHELLLTWFGGLANGLRSFDLAWERALDNLPDTGGLIRLPSADGQYLFEDSIVANKPINLIGHGSGLISGLRPTELRFAAGKGIVLTDLARKSVIEHLAITSEDNSVGTGVGIRCRSSRSLISDVYIDDFGSHGLFFDTATRTPSAATESGGVATITVNGHGFVVGEQVVTAGFTPAAYNGAKIITAVTTDTFTFAITGGTGDASVIGTVYAGNANACRAEGVRSITNGGDGIRIEGSDSNIITLLNCDGSSNAGYGIYNDGDKTGIDHCHASTNTTGDFYDKGGSAAWINPYSEGGGKFVIDTASSSWGLLLSVGTHAAPTIWSGNPPVAGVTAATNGGWVILDQNRWARWIEIISAAGTNVWRLNVDGVTTDQLTVRNATTGVNVATFDGTSGSQRLRLHGNLVFDDAKNITANATTGTKIGTATSEKLAFWNKTPIVQPASANQAALTDSSGGTPDGTISAVSGSGDDATINNNFAELHKLQNEMRSVLVNLGLMKGSA